LKKLTITNIQGQKLAAWIHGDDKKKIIIQCHGFPSDSHGNHLEYAEAFAKKGLTALRFDFSGCGESEGNNNDWGVASFSEDLKAVISYVKSIGFEDINVMAASYGGPVAIKVLFEDHSINKLVLRSPAPDLTDMPNEFSTTKEDWQKQGYVMYHRERTGEEFKLPYAMLEDAYENIMFEPAKSITAKTLIIHGSEDKIIPLKDSQKLAENIPGAILIVLDGADHSLGINDDYSKGIDVMIDWFC